MLGYALTVRADEKIFRNGAMVFGFTSSFRMGQLLRYKLIIPEHSPRLTDIEYMSTVFIDEARKCLKAGGYSTIDSNVETGGRFIVGYKGQLYRIDYDYQVGVSADPFCAVGCGGDYAHAALWINHKHPKLSAKAKVIQALKAAEHFSAGVRGPFKVIKLSG